MSENKLPPSLPAQNGVPNAYGEYDTGFVFEHYAFPDMWDYGTHAHPMMQYSLVLSGNLAYSIGQNQYVIPAGSGFFVNFNRFHRAIADPNMPSDFLSFLISPEFVTGRHGSHIAGKYSDLFISPEQLDCLELHPHDPSAVVILENMRKIEDAARHKNYGYELTVKALSAEIWLQTILMLRQRSRSTLSAPQNADRLRQHQSRRMLPPVCAHRRPHADRVSQPLPHLSGAADAARHAREHPPDRTGHGLPVHQPLHHDVQAFYGLHAAGIPPSYPAIRRRPVSSGYGKSDTSLIFTLSPFG